MTKYDVRHEIKLARTTSENIGDIIGYSFFLGSILFLIFSWNDLPDKVPAHYNGIGEVDRWGSKMELLTLPIIGSFIAIFMQVLEKFPQAHNYPERLNEKNASEFYLTSRKMLNQIKNICLFIFSLILIESISIPLGWGGQLSKWFLPILLVSVCVPIGLGIIKQRKIR